MSTTSSTVEAGTVPSSSSTSNTASSSSSEGASVSSSASAPGVGGGSSLAAFTTSSQPVVEAVSAQAPPPAPDQHSIDSVLCREVFLSSYTFNGTEVFNANLLGNYDPLYKVMVTPLVASVTAPYKFFRGDVEVRVRCVPPGNCMGSAIIAAVPEGGLSAIGPDDNANLADNANLDTYFTAPHSDVYQLISFEQDGDYILRLPFHYFKDYLTLPLGSAPWCWRLQMQSLVPLQSTVNTAAVATINIYAKILPGYTLGAPYYQAKKPVTNAPSAGPKPSAVAGKVASIATSVGSAIPMLAPFTAPVAAGMEAISTVASWFGFTRDALFSHPEPVIQRLTSNLSTVDGVDTSQKLVMMSGAAITIDPAVGAGEHEDPLSFEALRQHWGIITSFDLTTATAAGSFIFSLPVCPLYAGINLGSAFFTPGGYYGLPFKYWRGGMEYMIYIPSSSSMRGQLQIFWNPGARNAAPPFTPSADPTNYANSISLNLNETTQHFIQVPYCSPDPVKENQPMCDGKYSNRVIANCNGSLEFYLAAPYVAPRSGTISTKIVVFARPAADMKFSYVRNNFNGGSPPSGSWYQAMTLQSKRVDQVTEMMESTIIDMPSVDNVDVGLLLMTEVAPSARALMQKFSAIGQASAANTNPAFGFVQYPTAYGTINGSGNWLFGIGSVNNFIPYVQTTNTMPWSWLAHFAVLFSGVRGGTRMKLVPTYNYVFQPPASGSTSRAPAPGGMTMYGCMFTNETITTNPFPTSFQGVNLAHTVASRVTDFVGPEFGFPHANKRLYYNPRAITALDDFSGSVFGGNAVGVYMNVDEAGQFSNLGMYRCDVFYAGGEDITVTRFRRVPRMIASTMFPAT